jgi:O-antigen/teichoic acid export membrane protein
MDGSRPLRMTSLQAIRRLLDAPGHPALAALRLQFRDVGYLVAGNALKIMLALGTSAIIFRTLGPSDAGRLALALSVVGLLSIVGEFGLRDAAVNYIAHFWPATAEQAYAVARTFLICKIVLSAFASAVGILGAGLVAAWFYPGARVGDLIWLGSFSLFTSGLLAFSLVILEAERDFGRISALNIIQSVLRAALVAALFLLNSVNLFTLLALEALVPLAVFLYSLRVIPRAFYSLRGPLLMHLGTLFHFTKWIAVAALASAIFTKLDVLILSYYRAPAEVGFYAVAVALVSRLDIVKTAVLTTAFPEACRRGQHAELRSFVLQSLRLTALATLAFLPLFVVGGYAIEWLYGNDYIASIPAFYILLVGFLVGLNAQPAAFVLYPLNRPRWIAASDVVQLAFQLAANLLLIPSFGIIGAAWGVLLSRTVGALITSAMVRQLLWRNLPA